MPTLLTAKANLIDDYSHHHWFLLSLNNHSAYYLYLYSKIHPCRLPCESVSHFVVWLCVTQCPVACQAPLSMGFPGVGNGKNTGVGFYYFLQGIVLTQGSNLCLLHCRQILYHLNTRETQAGLYWSLFHGLGISLQLDIKFWEDKNLFYLHSPCFCCCCF